MSNDCKIKRGRGDTVSFMSADSQNRAVKIMFDELSGVILEQIRNSKYSQICVLASQEMAEKTCY